MILTLKNQTNADKTYLGGTVVVSANSSYTLPRELNVIICSDANFINDCSVEFMKINNGASEDLSGSAALLLIQNLAAFTLNSIATLFLYYTLNINVVQSAATTAGSTVWTLKNSSLNPYAFVIETIILNISFGGTTPLGSADLAYSLSRFTVATPAGGSSITPIKHSNLASAPGLSAMVLDTGLTMTSAVFEDPFDVISCPAVKGSGFSKPDQQTNIKIAPGEGVAIRLLGNDAIVKQALSGKIVGSLR